MPAERIAMRLVREILRLITVERLPVREIARRTGKAPSTVRATLGRCRAAGVSWPLPEGLGDSELEERLYGKGGAKPGPARRTEPDWASVHRDLALARGDGRHARLLRTLSRVDVLILDDFGLGPLDALARQDLLEIVEERYGRRSTIITSQPPVDKWHELIGEPTYADAILDRIVHNAHRIDLDGETIRKTRARAGKKE